MCMCGKCVVFVALLDLLGMRMHEANPSKRFKNAQKGMYIHVDGQTLQNANESNLFGAK